jgi:hypothetical protein
LEDAEKVDEIDKETLLKLESNASSEGIVHVEVVLFKDIKNNQGNEHIVEHIR